MVCLLHTHNLGLRVAKRTWTRQDTASLIQSDSAEGQPRGWGRTGDVFFWRCHEILSH